MGPSAQRSKDQQDEARREQQADERIHELEQQVERMQRGLLEVMDYIEGHRQNGPMSSDINPEEVWAIAESALDGRGDAT